MKDHNRIEVGDTVTLPNIRVDEFEANPWEGNPDETEPSESERAEVERNELPPPSYEELRSPSYDELSSSPYAALRSAPPPYEAMFSAPPSRAGSPPAPLPEMALSAEPPPWELPLRQPPDWEPPTHAQHANLIRDVAQQHENLAQRYGEMSAHEAAQCETLTHPISARAMDATRQCLDRATKSANALAEHHETIAQCHDDLINQSSNITEKQYQKLANEYAELSREYHTTAQEYERLQNTYEAWMGITGPDTDFDQVAESAMTFYGQHVLRANNSARNYLEKANQLYDGISDHRSHEQWAQAHRSRAHAWCNDAERQDDWWGYYTCRIEEHVRQAGPVELDLAQQRFLQEAQVRQQWAQDKSHHHREAVEKYQRMENESGSRHTPFSCLYEEHRDLTIEWHQANQKNRVFQLYTSGKSISDIARELGIGEDLVRDVLGETGPPPDRMGNSWRGEHHDDDGAGGAGASGADGTGTSGASLVRGGSHDRHAAGGGGAGPGPYTAGPAGHGFLRVDVTLIRESLTKLARLRSQHRSTGTRIAHIENKLSQISESETTAIIKKAIRCVTNEHESIGQSMDRVVREMQNFTTRIEQLDIRAGFTFL